MEIANHSNQTLSSRKKKKKNQSPEAEFRFALDTCSANNDLPSALSLFDSALSQNLCLLPHHFNTLLYPCSASLHTPSAVKSGFRIYHHMLASNIPTTEATITAAARLASAKRDGDLAFSPSASSIPPPSTITSPPASAPTTRRCSSSAGTPTPLTRPTKSRFTWRRRGCCLRCPRSPRC